MHILFISPYVPSPIRVRPYQFIRALVQRGHQITLVCSIGKNDGEALSEMRQLCSHVTAIPMNSRHMALNALRSLPGTMPLQAALNFDNRFLEAIRREVLNGHYDVAHIEHLRGSALEYGLFNLPTLLDSVDCISLLFERALRGSPSWKSKLMALADLSRTREYEARYTERYDQVIVSSPEDAWALERLRQQLRPQQHAALPAPVVVPNGVDLHYFAPQGLERDPATIVFSGKMAYHANEAAALFLVQEIMPLVWERVAAARVVLAGSSPPRSLLALAADPRVQVTGFLPDLRPALATATVAACPLRYGVGIQNKVLEAMAMGTPVVAARQAARALNTVDGRDLVLATKAEEYAQAILDLISDPLRAASVGASGRRYVERHHDWESAAERLEELYQAIAKPSNGSAHAVDPRFITA
jgi:glycosyltransferase involved in cell wall biosynthesis